MGNTVHLSPQHVAARIGKTAASLLSKSVSVREILFLLAFALSFFPWCNPPLALLLGLTIALTMGHPYRQANHKATSWLLQASVVGLGFSVDFMNALKVSGEGFVMTATSIAVTLLAGWASGRLTGNDRKASLLISSGTAICGGSAIAAIAPVIDASEDQASVALGTVFMLNAAALFIFPGIGHLLHMTQHQFGMWSAIAIHDTSSVVGAAGKFGTEALGIATTVKLARSLWIVPLAAVLAFGSKKNMRRIRVPWFIGLFVAAMLFHTFIPSAAGMSSFLSAAARTGLTVSLFLIGAGFSTQVVKQVGWRSMVQGIITWLAVAVSSLAMVLRIF